MAARGLISPYTVGFGFFLIPTAIWYVYGYKSEEDRAKELEKKGYYAAKGQTSAAAGGGGGSVMRANSKTNQQLLEALFANRKEPDLYKSLGEHSRRAPAEVIGAPPSSEADIAVQRPPK